MSLKSTSKWERALAAEKQRTAELEAILETGKPPEKSTFSKWRLLWVPLAAGAVAGAALIYASQKEKNGSPKK